MTLLVSWREMEGFVYAFEEFSLADFMRRAQPDALALVRDDKS